MFRKTLCVPLVLAFAAQAVGQTPPPPRFREGQVVRNRAEQQLWLDRKAAWEAAQAEKDNTLYLTEQQVRELRFEKKVVSVDGFDQKILEVQPADANMLRIRPLKQGATAFDVVDEDGNSRHYVILVDRDTRQIELILRRHFPDAKIDVDAVQDAVLLSGEVADPLQIEQAVEVAEQFYPRVLNWLKAASDAKASPPHQLAATNQPAPAAVDPPAANAPAFKPAAESEPGDANLRNVISEIRSLRTVIQEVRGDVMRLRFALQSQSNAEASSGAHTTDGQPVVTGRTSDAHQKAVEKARFEIERALDEPATIDVMDMPLREVLQHVSESSAINIVVDARAIEEEGITVDQPVSLAVQRVTLRSALNQLVADLGLTWVIEDEVLKITNRLRAAGRLTAKVYRIPDVPGSEADRATRLSQVRELIMATIAPDTWNEVGGVGHIAILAGGHSLVIRQTEDIHARIDLLLKSLGPLMTSQKLETQTPAKSAEPWDPQRLPVRTVDRLRMEDLLGRGKTPVVVLPQRQSYLRVTEQPAPGRVHPEMPADMTFRQPTRKPLAVASGSGSSRVVNKAVSNLPRVDAKGGVYIENERPANTIKTEVRTYSPSSELLQKFRADGDVDIDAAKKLIEHIRSSINPDSWDADAMNVMWDKSGSIQLVIAHTPGTHDRVGRLLERLEAEVNAKQPDEASDSGQASTDSAAEDGQAAAIRDRLGLKFAESVSGEIKSDSRTYQGGLLIAKVQTGSPAAEAGIQNGDILVGIHNWETLTSENVDFALQQINEGKVQSPFKFYVVRNGETLTGRIMLSGRPD